MSNINSNDIKDLGDLSDLGDLDMPGEDQLEQSPSSDQEATAELTADSPTNSDEAVQSEPVEEEEDLAAIDTLPPARSKTAAAFSQVAQASPFTVMLAISVLAIGIALICLVLEWNSYGFTRKPPKNLSFQRLEQSSQVAAATPQCKVDRTGRDWSSHPSLDA